MARRSDINYYASLGAYVTTIRGVRYILAKGPENDPETRRRAEREFKRLQYLDSVSEPEETISVYAVLTEYVKYVEKNRSKASYDKIVNLFKPFIADYQDTPVSQVKPQTIYDFVHKMSLPHKTGSRRKEDRWNQTTEHIFIGAIRTAFKWAEEVAELIKKNPLTKKMVRPPKLTRSDRAVMTEEQFRLFLAYAKRRRSSDYSTILELLWVTGARPSEIYRAKKEEWRPEQRSIIIQPKLGTNRGYKQVRHGKLRIIHVPDEYVGIVNGHAQWSGDGFLFHNERGRPYSKNGIESRTKKIRKAINKEHMLRGEPPPISDCISLYSARHSFASRWLKSGGTVHDLATLIDSSVEVIMRNYAHLAGERTYLKHQLDNFIGKEKEKKDGTNPSGS